MRGMKRLELTVLSRDVDAVIEFLGCHSLIHLSDDEDYSLTRPPDEAAVRRIKKSLNNLSTAAAWLEVPLPAEPEESSRLPGEAEAALAETIIKDVSALRAQENEQRDEKLKVEDALNEARAFANLNAPFSDLDQLSYLALRVGRLDPRRQEELRKNLSDRAVIVPLGADSGRVLAAASRKGRFALDTELKKLDFVPIEVPEGYKGIPAELLSGLECRLEAVVKKLEDIGRQREALREEHRDNIQSLAAAYLMAGIVEQLKARLVATKNVFFLSGWVPADAIRFLLKELEQLTEGRIAVRSYDPEELDRVKEGKEKVPVSLKHSAFVKGFEGVVFSYGAPLYGTIDPTPLVAFFFTILFGIMFGDLGQGLILLLLGILTSKRGAAFLSRFRKYSTPLVAVGISSMVMGFLNGSVFTNEKILEGPTRALTAFLTGRPMDRILVLMPLPEHGGSITKLFYFFAFTVGIGVLLISAGLIVNTLNQFIMKKYEKALFSRTGLSGILLFWYAIFIALRFAAAKVKPAVFTFDFYWFDIAGFVVPLAGMFMGPAIWRLVSGKRPVFEEGVIVYIMEGFVEILETVSTYISNTVSFLRVGAFALSHAVLSYIVFRFSEEVQAVAGGPAFSLLILVFGNLVIILLEGMIVAIQVMRLQYYEFFSKFFTETGIEFSPFRFRKEAPAE